jgi:hypothetical protein
MNKRLLLAALSFSYLAQSAAPHHEVPQAILDWHRNNNPTQRQDPLYPYNKIEDHNATGWKPHNPSKLPEPKPCQVVGSPFLEYTKHYRVFWTTPVSWCKEMAWTRQERYRIYWNPTTKSITENNPAMAGKSDVEKQMEQGYLGMYAPRPIYTTQAKLLAGGCLVALSAVAYLHRAKLKGLINALRSKNLPSLPKQP